MLKQHTRAVYTIVKHSESKSHWVRIGVAFTNRDGSINVVLDALPMNGRLQVREFPEADAQEVAADEKRVEAAA